MSHQKDCQINKKMNQATNLSKNLAKYFKIAFLDLGLRDLQQLLNQSQPRKGLDLMKDILRATAKVSLIECE